MISCVMCFKTIEAYPCECGANVQTGAGQTAFIQQVAGTRPIGITLDEFGLETFEAVKAMAARNQALKTAAVFRRKGLTAKVRDAEAAAEIAGRTVTALVKVERVTGDDVRKILAMGDAPC